MNVLVIGRGRVGHGLARALDGAPDLSIQLGGRRISPAHIARADVIVIAVPDDAIEKVARGAARHASPEAVVLHCAGARGTDVLAACEAKGCAVGVMHPFVSFPSKRSTPSLAGATFTVHGVPRAVSTAATLAEHCGAHAISAETTDPAYHAVAALTANGTVGLAFAAVEVLERLGYGRRDAERAVGGVLRTVAENVQALGVPQALTGPVARGEPDVVARHRKGLRRHSKRTLATYDAIVPVIVRCAQAAGLSTRKAKEILSLVER